MHAAGVEFNHTLFVGKAAESDAIVVRIIFRAFHDAKGGVQRIAPVFQESERIVEVIVAIVGADDDRALAAAGGSGEMKRIFRIVLRFQTSRH